MNIFQHSRKKHHYSARQHNTREMRCNCST